MLTFYPLGPFLQDRRFHISKGVTSLETCLFVKQSQMFCQSSHLFVEFGTGMARFVALKYCGSIICPIFGSKDFMCHRAYEWRMFHIDEFH